MWLPEVLVFFLFWSGCVAQKPDNNTTAFCKPGGNSCSECYRRLVYEAIIPERNQFNMQRVFFPADTSNPVYVTVNFDFGRNNRKTFYWSASTFFSLFHPLPVYQFTSLFFGDYEFRKRTLNLTLIADCAGAPDYNLQFLTQRGRCRHKVEILFVCLLV